MIKQMSVGSLAKLNDQTLDCILYADPFCALNRVGVLSIGNVQIDIIKKGINIGRFKDKEVCVIVDEMKYEQYAMIIYFVITSCSNLGWIHGRYLQEI
jgi:hypothetical protein